MCEIGIAQRVEYLPRMIDGELERRLKSFPAVMVVGPRACGKTTSAARLAASVVRLDQPATANVFRADPDAALGGRAEPVLLDEWQDVPDVLGAVKRAVDSDARSGRFVLTGSVSAQLDFAAWPGTGRLVSLPMYGLMIRERLGGTAGRASIEALLRGASTLPADRPNLAGYVDLALASGFPEALRLDDPADRRLWLDSYVDQLVTRDVARVSGGRDPERLRRYLQAWSWNSAGTADDVTIYGAVGIDRRTHVAYEQILRKTFTIDLVPAWTSNRLKRLVLSPKRYVVDSGLMAAAARFGRSDVLDNADLLGRLIDTFVASEVRAQASVDATARRWATSGPLEDGTRSISSSSSTGAACMASRSRRRPFPGGPTHGTFSGSPTRSGPSSRVVSSSTPVPRSSSSHRGFWPCRSAHSGATCRRRRELRTPVRATSARTAAWLLCDEEVP